MKKLALLGIFALAACGPAVRTTPAPAPAAPAVALTPADSFLVVIMTTKGDITLKAHRDWSPEAVSRFYDLAKGNVWKDARFFRVVPGFVVQWGLTGDSAVDNLWKSRPVPDEPVKVPNLRGRVSFARGGPQTRTLQVFINLTNNGMLDEAMAGGVRGYPPFAEVVSGMDVVDRLESKYGEQPTRMQPQISANGNAWLDSTFPGLDRIIATRITTEWR
jgi:peptidyl-prolyl cis-trans isomerase A (cyclophilin A)